MIIVLKILSEVKKLKCTRFPISGRNDQQEITEQRTKNRNQGSETKGNGKREKNWKKMENARNRLKLNSCEIVKSEGNE